MAKMFYSAEEAAKRLNKSESELKDLIRAGKLREFRDAGKVNYKVQDVDALAVKLSNVGASPKPAAETSASASASGEIVLEAVEDSGIELAPSGSDVLSLEAADVEDTRVGLKPKKSKEGTVVPSVGVNVFDDDELDESVDPLAQTAVTDVAGLGIEGVGSGSGIMDLTRESDDTSLGAELLEEIYTDEGAAAARPAAAEDTRAGLDEAVAVADDAEEEAAMEVGAPAAARARVTRVVEYPPDAVSTALTAAMVVAVVVMWVAGLAGAAMVRGVMPSLLDVVYANLPIFAGGAFLAAAIAAGVTWFINKRSAS